MQLVDGGPTGCGVEAHAEVRRLELAAATQRRRAALAIQPPAVVRAFGGSKPHIGALSPGCERCGQGLWSCLFINRACPAGCFFCPDDAAVRGAPPQAERIVFPSPDSYGRYVRQLGYLGVGVSGGEPFGDPGRLAEYVEAVRSIAGERVYLWAYTSGHGVTAAAVERAAAAGLNELRFNLVASGYRLGALKQALGRVERVTVEIPAVPEDARRLRALLPALQRLGVAHVNLHGLLGAGTNGARLVERGYTLTAGSTPLVVESELSALETLRWVAEQGLELPLQYCSLAFKQRWQNRVEDLRAAPHVGRPGETVTEVGCLRRIWVEGTTEELRPLAETLARLPEATGRWELDAEGGELCLEADLVGALGACLRPSAARSGDSGTGLPFGGPLKLRYTRTVLGARDPLAAARSFPGYSELELGPELTVGMRRLPVSADLCLTPEQADALAAGHPPAELAPFEQIARGLPDYV